MENVKENAMKHYQQGKSCSESVLLAFRDAGNPISQDVLNAVQGMRGGIGGGGCVCGAVLGGAMAAGVIDPAESHRVAQELHQKFKERYKTTCCRSLRKSGECIAYVGTAAELVVNGLKEKK